MAAFGIYDVPFISRDEWLENSLSNQYIDKNRLAYYVTKSQLNNIGSLRTLRLSPKNWRLATKILLFVIMTHERNITLVARKRFHRVL